MKYYSRDTKTEVPAPLYDPLNPLHVQLDENHIFFQPMPDGHEFTYDLNDIPNGTQPIPVDPTALIRQDLIDAGINTATMTQALFLSAEGNPSQRVQMSMAINTIALSRGVLALDVVALIR